MPRTPTPIDWDKVNLYLKAGINQKRIAESLMIDEGTLRRRVEEKYGVEYAVYAASLKTTGEMLIEAIQFQKAISGNMQMLLWLGKVRCGQKEPQTVTFVPPRQMEIEKDHEIMRLKYELEQLKTKLADNGDECQTGQELLRSDT